jgi:hypothetical protein
MIADKSLYFNVTRLFKFESAPWHDRMIIITAQTNLATTAQCQELTTDARQFK